jgi:riboflavin kinase/FMN adenylyltransferase
MTFDPHPRSVTRPGSAPALLVPVSNRIAMAHALGVDVVLIVPFTHGFAATAAEDFVKQTLVASLKAQSLVVGANFRFGAGGRGDISMLEALGADGGFDVEVMAPLRSAGRTCSSTEVRRSLAAGDTRTTQVLLGRPHLQRLDGLAALDDHA